MTGNANTPQEVLAGIVQRQLPKMAGPEARPSILSGSTSEAFTNALLVQAVQATPMPKGATDAQHGAAVSNVIMTMKELAPTDARQGMIAAQMHAMHQMTMRCAMLAGLSEQPHEIATGLRKAAAQASRTFCELSAELDRVRGKRGQQLVRVEHVHVHDGGKAIVGATIAAGGGGVVGIEDEAHACGDLAGAPGAGMGVPTMRSADPERQPVQVPSDAERPMPAARRQKHRPPHPGGAGAQ
jgi:hypothetical protein